MPAALLKKNPQIIHIPQLKNPQQIWKPSQPINLPDASGWDVLRDIAAAGVSTPAVVFSAVPPSTQRVREFQPYGVLVKPFPIDALVRLVDQVEKEKFGE